MKSLNQWVKAHPYKAMGFAVFFTLVAALAAITYHYSFWVIYAVGAAMWVAVFCSDAKKVLIGILAFTCISGNAQEQRPAGPVAVGVGVVVICVGGYCVYKICRFCQKKFPKENAGTNAAPSIVAEGDEMAASWSYGALGSCDPTLEPPGMIATLDTSGVGTMLRVDVDVDIDGNVRSRTYAIRGEAVTQGWLEFQEEVMRHGVFLTGNADNSQFFSINRIPCPPHAVPITFDANTKTVNVLEGDGPLVLIEVERSRDLVNWTPFLAAKMVAGGRGARIEDATTAASMFYRVNVSWAQ